MSRSLVTFVIIFILFQTIHSPFVNADEPKQTTFGGVKLGTKAEDLGIKLDDYRAWYDYKNKYYLTGVFNQKGHPITRIELHCDRASAKENLLGFGCDNRPEDILKKFGKEVEFYCQAEEPYSWEDQTEPMYLYKKSTNQYWNINLKNEKIFGFGIALEEADWRKCFRKYSDDEISKVKLGKPAKEVFGDEFYAYLGFAFLNANVRVFFDSNDSNNIISEINYTCNADYELPKNKIDNFGCHDSIEKLLSSNSKITPKCGPIIYDGSQHIWAYYNEEKGVFWTPDDGNKVIRTFGYRNSIRRDWEECKSSFELRLISEAKSRMHHQAPLPLKVDDKILSIKGITLGSPLSSCPNVKAETWSEDRLIMNICTIEDGDNVIFVYFDKTKSYVVKILRVVYVKDKIDYINDVFKFYGKNIFKSSFNIFNGDDVYSFGDTEQYRGLDIRVITCLYMDDGVERLDRDRCAARVKYKVVFSMIDVPAYMEAEADGRELFNKNEF